MARKTFNSLMWLGLAASILALGVPRANAKTVLIERIIARINNKIITQRQYDKQAEDLHATLARKYSGAELQKEYNIQKKNLLRDMIDSDLMVQKAADDSINVETDVVKYLDQIRKQYNLPSLEALQQGVESEGMNWQDFKNNIKRKLLMQEVISREVGGRVMLTREDARKYFEAHKKEFYSPPGVHLAEILISTTKYSQAQAEKRAQKALNEINNGARFSDVAQELSDAPSAKDGGDVGFFKQGVISPQIDKAIANLDTGDVSKIIKTQYGYIIYKVLEKRVGRDPTFNQISGQVMQYLYNKTVNDQLRGFLTTLRKESYIRLAPGFVDTGAPPGGDENY